MLDLNPLVHRRCAILGVGNELNGDDAAGLLVVRRLLKTTSPVPEHILIVEAGPSPENFTGTLRQFRAQAVVLVDAAEMGLAAGEYQFLDWREAQGWSGSTHSLPLSILATYITSDLGCQVFLVGIQPESTSPGQSVSAPVEDAIGEIARQFGAFFIRSSSSSSLAS